ncbi:MAG: hypothetical protein PXZ07_00930 [Candidatus Eremiobacteraeota bacterium]|nr:hypothetical protein [Candidatus Eremiobacteraeota bacterium]
MNQTGTACDSTAPLPSGTNESDTWGPNGHPAEVTDIYASTLGSALDGDTANEYLHWDGNAIAYSSSNYVNGLGTVGANGVDQVFIGNFATYVPSTFPGGAKLSVQFRDESGTRLECGGSPFNNVCGTFNVGGPPIDVQVSQPRADGYQIGMTTIQGVRAYDPGSAQWTTPDAYAGVVSDPMSQQSYMWNDNNPIAYTDPSGYEGFCVGCMGNIAPPSPRNTKPNSDIFVKVEAYGGLLKLFSVNASITVTTAPGLFVSGGGSIGLSKPGTSIKGVGVGGSVGIGIVTANPGHSTSGMMKNWSKGFAVGWGIGVEHLHNNSGQANEFILTTPQVGGSASYGIQLLGGKGASPPKTSGHVRGIPR